MSQRSKEALFYILCAVIVAGVIVFFQYHTFHWWLLIGPAFAAPFKIIYFRRQKHWDDLRERRERWGLSYMVVHEWSLDALAPVVARLAGS